MISIKVKDLKGHEILAKHIVTDSGLELIAAGIRLKKEYVNRLKELNIDEVYIEESSVAKREESFDLLKEVVKDDSKEIVKKVLEKHIFKNTDDLTELFKVADDIISNAISDENILTSVTNIRQSAGDLYTHSVNVCALSTVLALKKGFKREVVSDIAKGCLLHDIGLRCIVIPYENQDIDKLPIKNQIELKKHVVYGYDSIENVDWLSDLSKNIVLLHHERNDGSGYPFKNCGTSIRDEIKIVSVCDVFESLVSGIGYNQHKVHEAIEYIKQMSEQALDKEYVDTLLKMIAMYPVGTKVKTNEGEIGVVIKQNRTEIDRPIIQILKDRDGNDLKNELIKDMMKILTIFITEVIE